MSRKSVRGILEPNDFEELKKYCSVRSITYLKDSLSRLERGIEPTPSFPLYERRDISVVTDFIDTMEKLGVPDWLQEYEESRLAKFGPQGGVPKWKDLEENFLLYKTAPKKVSYVDSDIMREMFAEYKKLNCTKKSAKDSLAHLKHTDKIETRAAGWNQFELKKTDPLAQAKAIKLASNGDWKHGFGYVFSRYNKKKLRIFMPMPFSSMIKQAQYFISFLGNIQLDLLQAKHHSPYVAWADKVGFKKCFQFMGEEIRLSDVKDSETLVYFSNDFEKMDTRTGSSQYENFFIPVLEAAFHSKDPELKESMLFTTTAPIISPSGTMRGSHGTASGAEVTNGGEGVCNDYFQRRYLKLLKEFQPTGWRLITRRFNGDDSALVFAITCSLEQFKLASTRALKQACQETGFDIQFDKLDYSTEFGRYCQNVYYYDRQSNRIKWTYPITLILNSIMNPEHQYRPTDWDKDFRDLDIIVKLDNGADHPAYTAFVDYVMRGLKYPLLGQSEPETRRILSKYDKYRGLQALGERYNRQDYDISESPTVKYVLSKR